MSTDREHADLLAAWRDEHDPGVGERERMWAVIAARAEAGDLLVDEVAPASTAATTAAGVAGRSRVLVGGVALAAAAVLALVIAPPARELARTVEPVLQQSIRAVLPALERTAESVPVPVTPQVPAAIDATTLEPTAPRPVLLETTAPSRVAARTKPRREPGRIDASPSMDASPSIDPAEVELLERAQRRLASDPGAALALFDEHAKSYPRSALGAERELGRADARCRSGDVDGARVLVDRFIRTRPGSPLVARVRSICADAP